jgi:hypothetical protein
MTTSQIERELKNFAWEYIAASDKAQTDAEYDRLSTELDLRNSELRAEWIKRNEQKP